jgi:putative ABC transport system substrate-binding protein
MATADESPRIRRPRLRSLLLQKRNSSRGNALGIKPDAIAVTTTPAAHLLKKATRTVPIVMVALGDPLGTGLVDSLSRPSENITGMSLMVPQLAVKRLELLKELVPGISRVLVLPFLADPIAPIQLKAMEGAARSLGVTLQVQDIRTADDIPAAFAVASRTRAQGALITEESMFIVHRARVTELAAQHKLPAVILSSCLLLMPTV